MGAIEESANGASGAPILHLSPAADGWPAVAEQLRAARKQVGLRAILLDGRDGVRAPDRETLAAAAKALRALAQLNAPAVAAIGGATDTSGLALTLACSHVTVAEDVQVDLDGRTLLTLGVPWALVERVGAARAHALLLGPRPLDAARLAVAGAVDPPEPDPLGAARAVAERLALDASSSLLLRSLRAAQRSTAAQSAEYDRALVALLEGDDHVR